MKRSVYRVKREDESKPYLTGFTRVTPEPTEEESEQCGFSYARWEENHICKGPKAYYADCESDYGCLEDLAPGEAKDANGDCYKINERQCACYTCPHYVFKNKWGREGKLFTTRGMANKAATRATRNGEKVCIEILSLSIAHLEEVPSNV